MSFIEDDSVRVSEISVYNFGTYDSEVFTAVIPVGGIAFLGETGAGKSTFIDAYSTLLQGSDAKYNLAASQEKTNDRDIVSYIRGDNEQGSHRKNTTLSGISAKLQFDDGRVFTAIMLFQLNGSSRARQELKKDYFIIQGSVSLEDILNIKQTGPTQFGRHINSIFDVLIHTNNFKEYSATRNQVMQIDNQNAPRLLTRALGMKQVDDINDFIRNTVLEEGIVKQEAQKCVDNSNNLNRIDAEILTAKDQIEILTPIKGYWAAYNTSKEKLTTLENIEQIIDPYHLFKFQNIFRIKKKNIDEEYNNKQAKIENIEKEISNIEKELGVLDAQYNKLGGNKIAELKKEIEVLTPRVSETQKRFTTFEHHARIINIEFSRTNEGFQKLHNTVNVLSETLRREENEFERNKYQPSVVATFQSENKLKELKHQIKDVKNSRTSVAQDYVKLRDDIALNLCISSEDLPFIAELIEVKEEAQSSRGIIESVFKNESKKLLVNSTYIDDVLLFLEENHIGLDLELVVVSHNCAEVDVQSKMNGILAQLNFKEHSFSSFLKGYLEDFTAANCDEIKDTDYSFTQAGVVHVSTDEYYKNDTHHISDPISWCLGFSNETRLTALEAALTAEENKLKELKVIHENMMRQRDQIRGKLNAAQSMLTQSYTDIAYWEIEADLRKTQESIEKIKSSSEALSQINLEREKTKDKHNKKKQEYKRHVADFGVVEQTRELCTELYAEYNGKCQDYDTFTLDELEQNLSTKYLIKVDVEKDIRGLQSFADTERQRLYSTLHQDKKHEVTAIKHMEERIKTKQENFLKSYQTQFPEWSVDINGVEEYLAFLGILETEDLPKLQNDYNQQMTLQGANHLSTLNALYSQEMEQISERIERVNDVMASTIFRSQKQSKAARHLRISIKNNVTKNFLKFKQEVNEILDLSGQSFSDPEKEIERLNKLKILLQKVNGSLSKALAEPKNRTSRELLDVRMQMNFTVEEVSKDTGEPHVSYGQDGTGGKSGGEKESFTAAILAATLYYVLTPNGGTKPVFKSIFIDEAFSNTSEEKAREIARIFKDMGLQLNIASPYRSIDVAKESCASVIIANKDEDTQKSYIQSHTWEELTDKFDDFDV